MARKAGRPTKKTVKPIMEELKGVNTTPEELKVEFKPEPEEEEKSEWKDLEPKKDPDIEPKDAVTTARPEEMPINKPEIINVKSKVAPVILELPSVRITPNDTFRSCIAKVWYNFKDGVVQQVPPNVVQVLQEAGKLK